MTPTALDTKIKEFDNKVLHLSGLVKKADYDTKISEIEKNICNTSDYNTFTSDLLDAMIKGKKLVDQTGKAELKAEQNKILQLQVFDFFSDDDFQNMSVD